MASELTKAEQALEEILKLADGQHVISPPVAIIGHRDPWARIGEDAIAIARRAIFGGE